MRAHLREIIALIALAILSAAVFLILTSPSRSRLAASRAVIDQIVKDETALQQRMTLIEAAQASTGVLPAELLWTADDATGVEILQQQVLVDLADESDLQTLSFGAAQGPDEIGQATQAYEIEAEGGHAEVARFLAGIEQNQPRLAISYLWLRQVPSVEGEQIAPVNMRLAVWGFSMTGQGKP